MFLSAQEKNANQQMRKFQHYFECKMPFPCGEDDAIYQGNIDVMDVKKKAIENRIAAQPYMDNNQFDELIDDQDPPVQVDCFVGEKLLVHIKQASIALDPLVGARGRVEAALVNPKDGYKSYLFDTQYVRSLLGLKPLARVSEAKEGDLSQRSSGMSIFSVSSSGRSPSPLSLEEGIDNRYFQIQDSESTKSNSEERCAKCVML